MRVATYNVQEYGARSDEDERARYQRVLEVIAGLDADVLAIQEVCGGRARLLEIARATGMECYYQQPWASEDDAEDGKVALAAAMGWAHPRFHVGLLWRSGIEPRPHTWRTIDGEMWHNLAVLDLDVGGQVLRVGSYHGRPFGREQRKDEAERVASAFAGPAGRPPGIVGADWNSVSADRIRTSDDVVTYQHPDPYTPREWSPAFVYQTEWDIDARTGQPTRWRADRRPGEVLWAAGLRDTAALAGGPWQRTTGHADDVDLGDRAIDTCRVTSDLASAVVGHEVLDTELTRSASDHLPVVTTLDLGRLSNHAAAR